MVKKYAKKPVIVSAVQFDGNNFPEIEAFTAENPTYRATGYDAAAKTCVIPTLEGDHTAKAGDFIIRGVKGEFYPCKPDIFERTYEPAE